MNRNKKHKGDTVVQAPWQSPKLGPVQKKILLLLYAGVVLALARTPKQSNRILCGLCDEWQNINRSSLRRALNSLESTGMIARKNANDDTMTLTLTRRGQSYAKQHTLSNLKLPRESKWDGKWRIIIYDIPEYARDFRIALCATLRTLGCYELQRSVMVYPYDCEQQIKRVAAEYEMQDHIRFIVAERVDDERALRRYFRL